MSSTRSIVLLALLLVLPLLAGCMTQEGARARVITVPGKYDPNTCAEIDAKITSTTKQVDELTRLMSKANESSAGPLVSATVYWPTLEQARGELQILRETRAEKRCADGPAAPGR